MIKNNLNKVVFVLQRLVFGYREIFTHILKQLRASTFKIPTSANTPSRKSHFYNSKALQKYSIAKTMLSEASPPPPLPSTRHFVAEKSYQWANHEWKQNRLYLKLQTTAIVVLKGKTFVLYTINYVKKWHRF